MATFKSGGYVGKIQLISGNISVDFLGKTVKFKCPGGITEIIKVNEFDVSDGYMAIETNIGEEYLDLITLFNMNGLDYLKCVRGSYFGE